MSAGAASAVAAKLALAQGPAVLAYTDPGSEHPDNVRFLNDLEGWFGQKILRLKSGKYEDVDDVIEKTRYINGVNGARCTVELKRKLRFEFQLPDDRQVFGYTAEEEHRARRVEKTDPGVDWWWPLIEEGLNKQDCLAIIERTGIEMPAMYRLGYPNNNCIGCVKANNFTYWNMIREDFPEIFAKRALQERDIGHSICTDETNEDGKRVKHSVWLDELDPQRGSGRPIPNFDCSLLCQIAESQWN